MYSATIQLEALVCPSCSQKIESATKSVGGVDKDSVKVLFNASKVKFDFDPQITSVDDVIKAITSLGFIVKKHQVKEK